MPGGSLGLPRKVQQSPFARVGSLQLQSLAVSCGLEADDPPDVGSAGQVLCHHGYVIPLTSCHQ